MNIEEQILKLPDNLYKETLLATRLSLKQFTGLDTWVEGDMKTIRIFRRYDDGKTLAISMDIPYYDKHHPEQIKATKFNIFTVLEYTKYEAYTTQKIDWISFKRKFKECLLKLCSN